MELYKHTLCINQKRRSQVALMIAFNVIKESAVPESENYEQLSLFDTEETIKTVRMMKRH